MATIPEDELLKQFNDEQSLVYLTHKEKPELDEEMQKVLNMKLYRQFTAFMEQTQNKLVADVVEPIDEEQESENVTVEIDFKSPMKGVSETSPEIQAICKKLKAEIVIDQGIDLTLVVITASTEKACFDAQVKFWNAIAKHQKEIDCNYEAHLIEAWIALNEEQQLDFQNETNVRVSKIADEDECLLLSAFRDEHLAVALDKLRALVGEPPETPGGETDSVVTADYNGYQDNDLTLSEEPTEIRKDGICFTVKDEIHLKIIIEANVVGILIGKQGATIKWLKDHFGVTASVHGSENKTVVYLVAPDMESMILARKDILKTLRMKQKVKDTFYDDAVSNAWEQISEKDQLVLQNQTNVNIKLVENGTDKYLLLRAFSHEQLEDAKVKLYQFIVERPVWFTPDQEVDEVLDDNDDTLSITDATPTTAEPITFPVKPQVEDKTTDTSDLNVTEWLRETFRSTQEALHELPSLLTTINELKQKLEALTSKSNVTETVQSEHTKIKHVIPTPAEEVKPNNLGMNNGVEPNSNVLNVMDRVRKYQGILTP